MIFKQKILKEQKIGFFVCVFAFTAILVAFLVFTQNVYPLDFPTLLLIIFVYVIAVLPNLLIQLRDMEWYCIYKDRIEARNVFGLRNTVYYKEVSFVEEVDISVSIGKQKTYYIFNDGRKNTRNLLGIYPFYNNKKINLRIYKTKKLESYIKKNLRFKIV